MATMELPDGTKSDEIRALQELLCHVGERCDVDGELGSETRGAIAAFRRKQQARGRAPGSSDQPTPPPESGVKPSLPASSPSPVAGAVLDVAKTFLGTREVGMNDGPTVRKFLKDIGLEAGAPWCMAFVQYVVKVACAGMGVADALRPDSGHCLTVWESVLASMKHKPAEARAGDIFVMSFGGGKGHTGFVEKRTGDVCVCIEGNTDGSGGREGDGVYRRERKVSQFIGVIRL